MAKRFSTQESDRVLAYIPAWLATVLGLGAACLTLLAIFAFLYLILTISGLFQLLGEWSRRTVEGEAVYGMGFWHALGVILLRSTINILSSLWSAHWGFFAFGGLGCVAGLVTRRIVRFDPRLGGWGSFGFFLFAFLYVVVPGAFYLIGGSEAFLEATGISFDQAVLSSLLVELFAGVLFALAASILSWELWRLFFSSLVGWMMPFSLHLQQALREATRRVSYAPVSDLVDWRMYAAHLRRLKRDEQVLEQARWRGPRPGERAAVERAPLQLEEPTPTASTPPAEIEEMEESLVERVVRPLTWAALPALVLLLLCWGGIQVLRPYQARVAARAVENWAVVVSQENPRETFPIEIVYRPRTLMIKKLTGGGIVSIILTGPEPNEERVWALEKWDLREHPYTREYSIAHLHPGIYHLTFQFEGEVEGGTEAGMGYSYSQGGGPTAQYLGLVSGLMLTTALLAAVVILSAVVLRLYLIVQRAQPF